MNNTFQYKNNQMDKIMHPCMNMCTFISFIHSFLHSFHKHV